MKTTHKNNIITTGAFAIALGTGFAGAAHAQSAPLVYLNGNPLRLGVAPIQQDGRTLVPMRDIFEALGAQVSYTDVNQSITAQKGTTIVRMALGTRNATVNDLSVPLDVPAQSYSGRTMVPLRFVSEAMGANVAFNPETRIVSINSRDGRHSQGGTQVAGIRQISIPAQAVVPVTLDQTLTSATAYKGQSFTASVVSQREGDSEFPAGTRLEGTVTEASKSDGKNPGVLDMRFDKAVLPDGSRVNLIGNPVALDNDNVSTSNGRYVAKGEARKNNSLKVVGVGAGAGFVIGRLLKKDGLLSAIIGGAGGYLFDRSKNKNRMADAELTSGTKIGVRLRDGVTYKDTVGYAEHRSNYVKL